MQGCVRGGNFLRWESWQEPQALDFFSPTFIQTVASASQKPSPTSTRGADPPSCAGLGHPPPAITWACMDHTICRQAGVQCAYKRAKPRQHRLVGGAAHAAQNQSGFRVGGSPAPESPREALGGVGQWWGAEHAREHVDAQREPPPALLASTAPPLLAPRIRGHGPGEWGAGWARLEGGSLQGRGEAAGGQ